MACVPLRSRATLLRRTGLSQTLRATGGARQEARCVRAWLTRASRRQTLRPDQLGHEGLGRVQPLHDRVVELEALKLASGALDIVMKTLHALLDAFYERFHFH